MARKLTHLQSLAAALVLMCALPPSSWAAAAQTTSTASVALSSKENLPVSAGVPAAGSSSTTAVPTSTPAMATKKIPLAPPDVFEPAAEVASALPVPVPETLPSAEGLGFGSNGFGTNGGFGGCCGGFGSNGFGLGYNNGPLFFNSAPAAGSLRWRSMAAAAKNVLAPLLVACVSAMIYV